MKLEFRNGANSEILTRRLRKTVHKPTAAKLNAVIYNRPIIKTSNTDRFPELLISIYVYQLSCSCGASHVGYLIPQVRHHITEHHLA